jgi:cytochrome c-type biogenesis protein CcmH
MKGVFAPLLAAHLIFGVSLSGVWAAEVNDPRIEQQVMALSRDLRCLVCQNQSIAESDAPLALDLRAQVRQQLAQGRTEAEVRAYMVERYGDFILYRPPLDTRTLLLWLGPGLVFLGGLMSLIVRVRKQSQKQPPIVDEVARSKARAWLRGAGPDIEGKP